LTKGILSNLATAYSWAETGTVRTTNWLALSQSGRAAPPHSWAAVQPNGPQISLLPKDFPVRFSAGVAGWLRLADYHLTSGVSPM